MRKDAILPASFTSSSITTSQLMNLAQKVSETLNKGFSDVKLFAQEKLTTIDPDCVTELPPNYQELEQRADKVKSLYDTMLRLSANFTASDYDPSVSESVKDVVGKFNDAVLKPANVPVVPAGGEEVPKTFGHALARASSQAALNLGTNEPLGAACKKFSEAQQSLGDARLKLEADVISKFVQPWSNTLNMNIQFALKARKQVQTARFNFDSAKMRLKHAKNERLGQAQVELQLAEDEFNHALSDATHKIRLFVDSPEPLRNLANLVQAQLAYFKEGYDILNALAPNMEEMQVTQEALFHSK